MKVQSYIVPAIMLSVCLLWGCSRESGPNGVPKKTPPSPTAFLADAGKTPEATIKAYFHYNDRGDMKNLRSIVTENSLSMIPAENTPARSARSQKLRGVVVDHVEKKDDEVIVYYRSWFSRGTKAQGGRPYVAKLHKEDGAWKFDVKESLALTMGITKGKTKLGFYDGTKEWWK